MNDPSGYDIPVPDSGSLIYPNWLDDDADEPETTVPNEETDADDSENA